MTTQYQQLGKRILKEGTWVENKRTGKRCLTVINADFEYDVGSREFPIDTTRKSFWKAAVAEMLGYLKGYSNAEDFANLGAPTWLANANENGAWVNNPNRGGAGDMGTAYRFRGYTVGVFNNHYGDFDKVSVDQYKNIVDKLSKGIDDRRLIMSAYAPHFDEYACLPACMHTHHFSLVDGVLHLTSYQRSVDFLLGLNFNMVQCYFLLAITAQITGLQAGKVFHKMTNIHIYEDQLPLMEDHMEREPYGPPAFYISPDITCLSDVEESMNLQDVEVVGYKHHPAIKYPFSV